MAASFSSQPPVTVPAGEGAAQQHVVPWGAGHNSQRSQQDLCTVGHPGTALPCISPASPQETSPIMGVSALFPQKIGKATAWRQQGPESAGSPALPGRDGCFSLLPGKCSYREEAKTQLGTSLQPLPGGRGCRLRGGRESGSGASSTSKIGYKAAAQRLMPIRGEGTRLAPASQQELKLADPSSAPSSSSR